MQFKRQGNRIQVVAYRGYDKEKRRSVVKMLGSLDAYNYKPSDGLLDAMTDEEKTELQAYIEKERQSADLKVRQYAARSIASVAASVADTITAGEFVPSEAWTVEVLAAVKALTKAIRKSGTMPRKPRKPQAADASTPGLFS